LEINQGYLNYSPNDRTLHPKRPQSTATTLTGALI